MRAIDVMTRTVVTASPATPVQELARLMLNHRITGMPVVEPGGQVVGIISEGDLLRRVESRTLPQRAKWRDLFAPHSRLAAEYVKSHGRCAKDVMTRPVVTVDEMATLPEIADLLENNRIRRVPVLRHGKLVGIVSRANLLQVLASGGGPTTDPDADRVIRDRLLTELDGEPWANPGKLNVVVSDSIVHLWGIVGSEDERAALRVATENTPGVRGVEDHTTTSAHHLL